MVRNRPKAKQGNFTPESMADAVALVNKGMSIRKAATLNNVQKSTLARYLKKIQENPDINIKLKPKYNTRIVFTEEMEADLVNYVIKCAQMFYGLTKIECCKLAFQFAAKNKLKYPPNWDRKEEAGADWLYGFMKRHPRLSLRIPEGCSLARASSFNRHNVDLFFNNLENLYKRFPNFSDGTRIFNLDETGMQTVQKPQKIIAQKGVKQCAKVISAEKGTLVTTCCIVSASGNTVPPVMVFPRVNFKYHMVVGAPTGTLGLANKSGWMTSDLFVEVIRHFIKHTASSKENPTLLIYDNHESHLSIDSIQLAKDNGVKILTIPPHSSNKIQPLDVVLFKPFQTYYDAAVDSWMSHNPGQTFTIYNTAACVGMAHARAMTPENIISSFKKTGIFPIDKHVFTEVDFLPSSVTDRPHLEVPSTSAVPASLSPVQATPTSSQSFENFSSEAGPSDLNVNSPKTTVITGSDKYYSPEDICGYPKAGPRKNKRKQREKGRSLIATDTPEKAALAEKARIQMEKKNNKIAKKKNKTSTQAKRRLFQNTVAEESDSEDLDCVISLEDSSDAPEDFSDLEPTTDYLSLNALTENEINITVNSFVLVQFKVKNHHFYYVGKIVKILTNDEDGDYEIMYLRKSKKYEGKFVFPEIEDTEKIGKSDIFVCLPPPLKNVGTTTRQNRLISFNVKFDMYDIR